MAAAIADTMCGDTEPSVRPLATLAVLLARRAVLLSSVLGPRDVRTDSADLAFSVLGRCCDDATRDGDHPLAQLLDWTCAAWTGNPHDGSFFAGKHLPEQLYAQLKDMLDRLQRPMLVATAEQTLELRVRQLTESVDRHSAVDRGFCKTLIAEPVTAVIAGLSTQRTDGGLLEYEADELVKRANARQDRPIPPNGRRWPLLVRAVSTVREQVRELLDVAVLADVAAPGLPIVAPDDLPPELELVLSAATLADPDPDSPCLDDGDPLLPALVDTVLAAIGSPQAPASVRTARWATGAGLVTAAVDSVLAPVRLLTERADDLIASMPDQEQGSTAGLRELAQDAIRKGDVADLTVAVTMLESERDRLFLTRRIDAVERMLDDLDDPARPTAVQRYLRVARERLDLDELVDAAAFVMDAETEAAAAQPPRDAYVRTSVRPPVAPPKPIERPAARPDVPEYDEAAAKKLYEAGHVEEAVLRLRRLLQGDPRSPGAYLLLRIHREQHRLDLAVELVEQLVALGDATWRHHVELCRNAIAAGDLEVARDQYRRAEERGADDAWLRPLVRGMRTIGRPQPVPADSGDEQTVDAVLRLRAGELTQPAWREMVAEHVAAGRVDRALMLTRQAATVASWTPGLLFQVLYGQEGVAIDERRAVELADLARLNPHDQSMIALADLLLTTGWPEHALDLLDTAERIAAPPQLPRLWFVRRAVLRRLGRDDEADALLRHTRPPLPDPGRAEPAVTVPLRVPEPHWPRLITRSTALPIRAGQLHQADGDLAAAADAWIGAVRAGHPAVFPSALAALVASGRSTEALDFYAEFADEVWIGAGAAWNVGCAYAAAGRWNAAADSFVYHARVRTQPYDATQEAVLRALFVAVGRPLPAVAPPPAAVPVAEGGAPGAARRSEAHDFGVTAAAIRTAMRKSGPAETNRQLARVEVLYGQLPDPDPTATAEFVRTLAAGGRTDQAWGIVTEAIWTTGAARALLAPALQIAREGGPSRLQYLRELLEVHQDGDDFEVLLHLAKIASLRNDVKASRRHAARAMKLNPASAEAASMLGSSSPAGLSSKEVGPKKLTTEIRNLGPDRPDDVAASLEPAFAPLIEPLRMSAVALLGAEVDETAAKFELPDDDLSLVDDALRAAKEESWEAAARLFRAALARRPRHLGLATTTVTALIRTGHLDTARTIAETVAYAPMGREAQARVAFAARDYAASARYLDARDRRRKLRYTDVLGRAGLQLHFLDDPAAAVEVLLESSRNRLPGNANPHAALASVLARRHGLTDLCGEAVRVMLTDKLDGPAAVRWVIEHDNLEALREPNAPQLRSADLAALVAHFDPDQRDRLRRFLQHKQNTLFLRELAALDERDSRTTAAFDTRWLMTTNGSRDQLTHLRELVRFCQRTGYTDGYRRVLDYKIELGQPVTPDEQQWLDGQIESAEYRERGLGSDIRAFLYEIGRIDLSTGVTAVVEPVLGLVDRLTALTEGTADEAGVRRLEAHWTVIINALAEAHRPADVEPDLAKAARAFSEVRAVQAALGTRLAAEAAEATSVRLYAEWERLAHHARDADLVDVEVVAATRVLGGPVEVLLQLTAGTHADGLVVDLEAGSATTPVKLPAGTPHEVPLLVYSDAGEVEVVVGYDDTLGRTTRRHRILVVDPPEHDSLVDHDFSPNTPAQGRMFVGREQERAQLRMAYRGVVDHAVPLRFLEGPREVGKSSLARSLSVTGADPDAWPIPGVLTVYLDAEKLDVARKHLLHHVAVRTAARLQELPEELRTGSVPAPEIADEDDFSQWWATARRSLSRPLGLLVIIDEIQVLLRKLNDDGTLRSVFGVLRAFQQDGLFGLLLCGSCTLRTVNRWLAGTSMAGEVEPIHVGFLRRDETEEVVRRGFLTPVRILTEAVDEVWRVTVGYPNHIHLLGDEVAKRLEAECRRTVTGALVREVAYQLAGSSRTVQGIIKNDDDVLKGIDLLLDLRDPDDETAVDPTVRHRLTSEEREQLERYVALGLLRENSGRLEWANELMRLWLARRSDEQPSMARPLRVRDPATTVLIEAGYERVPPYRRGGTCLVERDGQWLVARRFTVDGGPATADVLDLLHDRFNRYGLASAPPGVPEYHGRVGDWMLFCYLPGVSLRDRLTQHPDVPIDPLRAARWIVNACDVLTRVTELWSVTHGDLRPGNIITNDDDVAVVGWGYGAFGAVGDSPSPLVPRTRDYASPQYLRRIATDEGGATPGDDVFALGVILFQFLHPDGMQPYPHQADDLDPETVRPAPVQADERLVACVHRAIALDDTERYRGPREFAAALRDAVPELCDLPDELPAVEPRTAPHTLNNFFGGIERITQEGNSMTGDNSISVKGSVTDSVVGHRNKVRDSLNRTQASSADDQVKELIAQLAEQVEALRSQVDPAEADALVRDFDSFSAEASSDSPRGSSLARIGGDLVENVSSAASAAGPLINLVQKIVELFQ